MASSFPLLATGSRLLQWVVILVILISLGLVMLFAGEILNRIQQYACVRDIEQMESRNQWKQVEQKATEALTQWPEEAMFYLRRGYSRQQQKKNREAAKDYQQGLIRHPTAYTFRHHYARLLQQLRQPNPAILQYKTILQAHPTHLPSLLDLAELYRFSGNRADALGFDTERDHLRNTARRYYSRVLQLQPDIPKAWFGLADLLQRDGQFNAAKSSYCQVLHSMPRTQIAWFNLGLSEWYLGHTENGMRLMNTALKLPVKPDTYRAQQSAVYALRQHYFLSHKKNIPLPPIDEEELSAFLALKPTMGQYVLDEQLPDVLVQTCAPWTPPELNIKASRVMEPPGTAKPPSPHV
jgi:tetratricopeptide (TPR) repeat protein